VGQEQTEKILHLERSTMCDKRDWIILYLSVSLLIIQVLWMRDTKRVSYLEGREAVFAGMTNGDEHACGPYEQPVHKNFQKKDKK